MLFKQFIVLFIVCLSLQVKAQTPGYLGRRLALEVKTGIYPTFVKKYANNQFAIKPYVSGQFNFAFVLNKRVQLVVTSSLSRNKATHSKLTDDKSQYGLFSLNEAVLDSGGVYHNERTDVLVDLEKNRYSFNRLGVGAQLRFYLKKVLAPIGTYFQISYSTVFSKVSGNILTLDVEYKNFYTNVSSFKKEVITNYSNRFHNIGFGFFRNLIISNSIGLNFGIEANFRLPSSLYTSNTQDVEKTMNIFTYGQQRDAFKRIFNYGVKVGVVKWF